MRPSAFAFDKYTHRAAPGPASAQNRTQTAPPFPANPALRAALRNARGSGWALTFPAPLRHPRARTAHTAPVYAGSRRPPMRPCPVCRPCRPCRAGVRPQGQRIAWPTSPTPEGSSGVAPGPFRRVTFPRPPRPRLPPRQLPPPSPSPRARPPSVAPRRERARRRPRLSPWPTADGPMGNHPTPSEIVAYRTNTGPVVRNGSENPRPPTHRPPVRLANRPPTPPDAARAPQPIPQRPCASSREGVVSPPASRGFCQFCQCQCGGPLTFTLPRPPPGRAQPPRRPSSCPTP